MQKSHCFAVVELNPAIAYTARTAAEDDKFVSNSERGQGGVYRERDVILCVRLRYAVAEI